MVPAVASSEEIYIVRVRPATGDSVVEDVRRRDRRHIADPSELGPLIARWIERARATHSTAARTARTDPEEDLT
jgi:hypothetical protein